MSDQTPQVPDSSIPQAPAPPAQTPGFPKYLMKIDGQRKFLVLGEAGRVYDSNWQRVEFGRYVLNADFTVRPMEETDRQLISSKADEYSGSK